MARWAALCGLLGLLVCVPMRPAVARGRRTTLVPSSATRYVRHTVLSPEATEEERGSYGLGGRSVRETILRIWNGDGELLEEIRDDLSLAGPHCWFLPDRALLVIEDTDLEAWRVWAVESGRRLSIPFSKIRPAAAWIEGARDGRVVAAKGRGPDGSERVVFYVDGKESASHELPTSPYSYYAPAEMTEDGFVCVRVGTRQWEERPAEDPPELILYGPDGQLRWRVRLPSGPGSMSTGYVHPAEGGGGVLCSAWSTDGKPSGIYAHQLYDAEGTPRPVLRFEEPTDFRCWVGSSTTALFESTRECSRPGHTLTLADCHEGRVIWQREQPDVGRSELIAVHDPTGTLGCDAILQAVHRTWEAGRAEGAYAPIGFTSVRLLREDSGELIRSYHMPGQSVSGSPARFHPRSDGLWLVTPTSAFRVDLGAAVRGEGEEPWLRRRRQGG